MYGSNNKETEADLGLEWDQLRIVLSWMAGSATSGQPVVSLNLRVSKVSNMQEEVLGWILRRLFVDLLDPTVVKSVTPLASSEQLVHVELYRGPDRQGTVDRCPGCSESNGDYVSAQIPVRLLLGGFDGQVGLLFIDMLTKLSGVLYTTQY